jgi:hypothetical protein
MPIIGMTRRQDVENAAHRLVYGELRKGGPKTDPKRPGPDLDHWRFTSERPEVLAAFLAVYGDAPKIIEAYLPFPDLERNWATWFEEYDAGGMKHRCDGQTMTRWRRSDGSYEDGEKVCPYYAKPELRTKDNPGCKQVGRLFLVLPALVKAGHVGLVTMGTHSINDLVSITTSLLDAEAKAGHLNGILFSIMRVKDTISTPAWKDEDKAAGKRNRVEKNMVVIAPQAEWVMARLNVEAAEQMTLAAGQPRQLSAPQHDDWNGYDDDDATEEGEPEQPEAEEGEIVPPVDDPPSAIKARLLELVADKEWKIEPASPEQVKKINMAWAILIPDADTRHAVREYLLDHDSSAYTRGEIASLLTWFDMQRDADGVLVPGAQAIADAKLLKAFLLPPEPGLFEADAPGAGGK